MDGFFKGCALFRTVVLLFLLLLSPLVFAQHRVVNFVVAYKTVHFADKNIKAIAVNNQIPGPTLRFKEGDHVTINVYNHLNVGTTIHWHGIILPWQMDGVEHVTQKAIAPGHVFHYRFTLRQSGTYWYHAHAAFQEQEGLYGALVVTPKKIPSYHYTKDKVIVLSDWSDTNPNQIYANLKKEGDYYSPRFPLQPSLFQFIRDYQQASPAQKKQLLKDYHEMQKMRMGIYDISDVAYDAFLLNGHTNKNPWIAQVKATDVVRLRFIDAGASTNFNVKIPGYTMTIVQVDGNDVRPYRDTHFFITPGETYDVLIKIQKNKPAILYAESADTRGVALGALTTTPHQMPSYKTVKPFRQPMPVSQEMMQNMMNHDASAHQHHSEPMLHGDHQKTVESTQTKTNGTKYQELTATVKTNNPRKPIYKIIHMELFGYMDRYIWMINGLPEYKSTPIQFKFGKRYRFIFTNPTMMHHPMHLHGHWFILRNGHGQFDPLLHTIDVAPGATVIADVDADASGQWFFHCHQLYHMMAGMSRVFQYQSIIDVVKGIKKPSHFIGKTGYKNRPIVRVDKTMPLIPKLVFHPIGHPTHSFTANFLDIGNDFWNNTQQLNFEGLYGGDYNKLKLYVDNAEMAQGKTEDANIDIFYWRLISQFWAMEGGMNYVYRPAKQPYWEPGIGIEGLMPYFIQTEFRSYLYHDSVKLNLALSRDTQITNHFFIRLGIDSVFATKTVFDAAIGSGLNEMEYTIRPYYRLTPNFSVFAQYQYTKTYGARRRYEQQINELPTQDIMTIGISTLF